MKHLRNLSRTYTALLIALVLIAWSWRCAVDIVHAQEAEQATVLDHPIDPDQLILSTLDGGYPFQELAGTDCSWVHSEIDVALTRLQDHVWRITRADATCNLLVGEQVDPTPCNQTDGVCQWQDDSWI